MSSKVHDPLQLAQTVLETLRDIDDYTTGTALELAHKLVEYRQKMATCGSEPLS